MTPTPETPRQPPAEVGAASFNGDQRSLPPAGGVTAVERDADVTLLSVQGRPADGGALAWDVLHVLVAHAVRVDVVSLSADAVRLTVPRADLPSVPGFLELVLTASHAELTVDEHVAKLSLTGHGLVGDLRNVHRVVTALSSHGIHANWVFASPTHIGIVVAQTMLPEATQVLRHAFELDEDDDRTSVN